MGQLQAQLVLTQQELQYAIEQIRILTLQVNSNASRGRSSGNDHSAGYDNSRVSLSNAQGKPSVLQDIIPNIFDGKQRKDFWVWAENSALYLSAQCVDACEILLEWLVSEEEHVTDTEIQTRCDVEDWEYDNINTFSRVTFVYVSMRTTGTARKIVPSGKRGDGLNAWRRLFQEYNPQLVTGAQALLRRALSMGRAKSVTDVGSNSRTGRVGEKIRRTRRMHISRSVQDSEIDGHHPRRRRETVDSGIHEHKAKLRVTQEQSVSVGTVESQRKVCNGLLTRRQWWTLRRSRHSNERA